MTTVGATTRDRSVGCCRVAARSTCRIGMPGGSRTGPILARRVPSMNPALWMVNMMLKVARESDTMPAENTEA